MGRFPECCPEPEKVPDQVHRESPNLGFVRKLLEQVRSILFYTRG
jgi:hypothetical protein